MIDFAKTYKVEAKPTKGDSNGLDRYGIGMFPGTVKRIGCSFDERTGKYRTGLDEFHPSVQSLPKEEREKEIEWIKATREELEKMIGDPGALDAKNDDFWELWRVNFEIDESKNVRVNGTHPLFNPENNWEHRLALITLNANKVVPLSKKDASNPEFLDSKFLVTTVEEEATFTKDRVRKTRERAVQMAKLFGDESNYERAWNIAYLLDIVKERVNIDRLEEILEGVTQDKEYLEKFLSLSKLEDEELALRVTVKQAIYHDIIKFNTADRVYYRGGVNFRTTEEATTNYLKMPEMTRELVEIKAEVAKKQAKLKKIR